MTKLVLVLCLCLVCTACGSHAKTTGVAHASAQTRGFALRPPVVAPAFALRDQDGRLTGPAQLRGHWYVVAFLYTHCPDVCPVIASNLGVALRRLPGLQALAISVDPKHDAPASVKAFLRAHNLPPRFRYVTGTHAELARVWARYHVAAIAGTRPIVSHTAFELLVDPQGRERVLYDAQVQAADIARDVTALS
jgi:protein SCO1/2